MFQKNVLSGLLISASLGLTACGVTSQDQGTGVSGSNAVSGLAIDGYIARAVVYVDTNENNKLDVWEPRALTDSRGYFSYSPAYEDENGNTVAAKNYCETTSESYDAVYCLNIPAGYDSVLIRMTQGLDLATVEKFTGTLSMRINTNSLSLENYMIGTPITGLLSEMAVTDKEAFLENEDIQGVETLDFLDFTAGNPLEDDDAQRLTLLKLALSIHKVADAVAGYLDVALDTATTHGEGGIFDKAEGLPTDASVYVYRAMVAHMASQNLSNTLVDVDAMAGIVSTSLANIKAAIDALDDSNKFDFQAEGYSDPDLDAISANSKSLADAIANIFSTSLATETYNYTDVDGNAQEIEYSIEDDAKSRIRAIDVISYLVRSGADSDVISHAISLAGNAEYMTNLKSPAIDLTGLKSKFVADGVNVLASDANYDDRQSFSSFLSGENTGFSGDNPNGFANNSMDISDNGDNTKVVFEGTDDDATSGTMTIDATFTEGEFAKTDENGDPIPLALEGTWEQVDEYTMLMNVEVAGVIEPVIVKPTLTTDDQGNKVAAYYFDLGGEQQIWIP